MMKIEQNLNKTDVRNYKQDILEQFILQCYRYSKYKTSAAMKKINRGHFTENTAKAYLNHTKQYLSHGTKGKKLSLRIYALLDKFKASHVTILTPTEDEKYTPRKPYELKTPTPLNQPTQPKTQTQKVQTPTQYGVKFENTIKLFDTKEFCLGYKECFETFNNDKKAELVTIEFKVVNESDEDNNDGIN